MLRHLIIYICLWLASLPLPAQTNKQIRSLQKQQSLLKKNITTKEKLLKYNKKDVHS